MKYTSEMLMKAMGLNVGDTIKLNGKTHTFTAKKDGALICKNVLKQLIDQEFEVIPKPKRVGDLKCNNECFRNNGQCPIRAICSHCNLMRSDKTLYEFLEFYKDKKDKYANEVEFDQEIYDLLKARLDKEVKE